MNVSKVEGKKMDGGEWKEGAKGKGEEMVINSNGVERKAEGMVVKSDGLGEKKEGMVVNGDGT